MQYQVGEVTQVLRMMEAGFEDASDLMKDVLLVMIRSTQLNFEMQGRPEPFADLAESTERRRYAKAMGAPGAGALGSLATLGSLMILIDSGLFMQSLGAGADGAFEAADGFGEFDEYTATLGSNRPGADVLQTGYPPHNLPAREVVLFQERDVEDMMQMAADFALRVGPYAA